MSSDYQPFAWLNSEKLFSDEVQYFMDLGLMEYYPAISVPLETAIGALLDDKRERVYLTPSSLPRVTKDVLHDPVRLSDLIKTIPASEQTINDFASPSNQLLIKRHGLEQFKVGLRNESTPQLNVYPLCHYSIDQADIAALQILMKFDEFFALRCADGDVHTHSGMKYLDLGMLFYYCGMMQVFCRSEFFSGLAESFQEQQRIARAFRGGIATKEKALAEEKLIKVIALEELNNNKRYRTVKLAKLPIKLQGVYAKDEFVPWNSPDLAATTTLGNINEILKKSPINVGKHAGIKSRNSVSKNTYTSIIKSISEEHPKLFKP